MGIYEWVKTSEEPECFTPYELYVNEVVLKYKTCDLQDVIVYQRYAITKRPTATTYCPDDVLINWAAPLSEKSTRGAISNAFTQGFLSSPPGPTPPAPSVTGGTCGYNCHGQSLGLGGDTGFPLPDLPDPPAAPEHDPPPSIVEPITTGGLWIDPEQVPPIRDGADWEQLDECDVSSLPEGYRVEIYCLSVSTGRRQLTHSFTSNGPSDPESEHEGATTFSSKNGSEAEETEATEEEIKDAYAKEVIGIGVVYGWVCYAPSAG